MIVVDTQIVVWLDGERSKLTEAANRAIAGEVRNGNSLAIADITLLEIAAGVARERISASRGLSATLRHLEKVYEIVPIDAAIAEQATRFTDPFPRDPADRLVAATAVIRGAQLITSDRRIRKSRQVACIW